MPNDYGVYTELQDGTKQWVVAEMPLQLGAETNAIHNWSFPDACSVATYLTNTEGNTFAPGRPIRKPH